jgi:hypothetical protein
MYVQFVYVSLGTCVCMYTLLYSTLLYSTILSAYRRIWWKISLLSLIISTITGLSGATYR